MKPWASTAGVAFLVFISGTAFAQVWVPGDPELNQTQQRGQPPDPTQQGPQPGQYPPDQYPPGQNPNQYPQRGVIWPLPKPAASQPAPGSPSATVPASSASSSVPAPSPEPVAFPVKDKDSRLRPETRLELIRYVSGEFAKARTSLPGGKAFKFKAGQPLDQKILIKALQDNGVAISPGDDVQITKLDFGGSDILIELNGGGPRKSWRDRIQISGGMSGPSGPTATSGTTVNNSDYGAVAAAQKPGISLQLDFGRPLPDLTPDELKVYLSSILDFSKQRSAAVTWTESQPPEIREAITAKRAIVGMDQDQVMAAMGRADKKVRERLEDGTETEDWIYGTPPGKTVFVKFAHEKVVKIDQYPHP